MARRSFKDRFPKVAALLAGSSLSSPRERDPDDDERERGEDERNQVDADDMRDAFEADAAALVTTAVADERKRWGAVMTSTEGKANVAGAVALLARTDMSAEDAQATLKEMGPAAKAPASRQPGAGDGDEELERGGNDRDRGRREARGRLRGDRNVDRDTGGGGGGERQGSDDLEAARERRRKMQERRNSVAAGGARGARRTPAG